MGLLLFIQKIPRLGIFVVMFTDILKTFGQFFLVFVFFILGFALAFTILLGNQVFRSRTLTGFQVCRMYEVTNGKYNIVF